MRIELNESQVIRPDGEFELTTREVELIRFLVGQANEPVSRDVLLETCLALRVLHKHPYRGCAHLQTSLQNRNATG